MVFGQRHYEKVLVTIFSDEGDSKVIVIQVKVPFIFKLSLTIVNLTFEPTLRPFRQAKVPFPVEVNSKLARI